MITVPNIQMALRDRANNRVFDLVGVGAPTNGTSGTGANITSPGSSYYDTTNRTVYFNVGSQASPYWQPITTGVCFSKRTRFTIAEINAGATLLAAITGFKYRMHDAKMISVGGAVGATTTVDILGTRAAASVKLLAVAIAALTQSAVVRAGAANAVVLADGASFTELDDNTAVTVGKTGATATTATHVDVLFDYQLVKS